MMWKTVLLVSGLPLKKDTSFKRQLELLGRFSIKRGIEPVLLGPDTDIEARIHQKSADAALLLGYHDQFPFLNRRVGIPLWLWAQLSGPVDPVQFGDAVVIPLTPVTEKYFRDSGVKRIGPVIPHGVESKLYLPFSETKKKQVRKQYGIEDEFVIGTVAANTKRKKLDRIIESYSRFASQVRHSLLFIKTDRARGMDGTDLAALTGRYGVRGKVMIIEDNFDEIRMVEVYNLMDIYLTLSEWEGFCIPVIEAMACGIPVCTHPVQGPGELVSYDDLMVQGSEQVWDGKTKLLLADPKEASKVLLYSYNNRRRLDELGRLGREAVKRKYDITVVAEMWERLIRKV
jgi:glycosyltransferase involved in cell wall biosynthesis